MMKNFKRTTKSWRLFCLVLSFIASIVLIANFSLVNAQNNTVTQSVQTQSNNNTTSADIKNIILVHGAFSDGSAWSQVIPILEKMVIE